MTLKVFREAYLAARYLEGHGEECGYCHLWALGRKPNPCPAATEAMRVRDMADSLLDIANTRQARRAAWLHRSRSRR